jgi:hypothetical protein
VLGVPQYYANMALKAWICTSIIIIIIIIIIPLSPICHHGVHTDRILDVVVARFKELASNFLSELRKTMIEPQLG